MTKSFFLSIIYLIISFLVFWILNSFLENYIDWHQSWITIPFNLSIEILFYTILCMCTYIWIRCFIKNYILIVFVSMCLILIMLYYTLSFLEIFSDLGISLLNIKITGILYIYMVMFIYFFIDFFYSFYRFLWQVKNWIKNWGWKFEMKSKKDK